MILLNEATYDIKKLNPLFKKVEEYLEKEKFNVTIDASNYFKDFIPEGKKAVVKVVLTTSSLDDKYNHKGGSVSGEADIEDDKTIAITLNTRSISLNPTNEDSKKKIIRVLSHEAIHAIDFLRSLEKSDTVKERGGISNTVFDSNTVGGWIDYISKDYEFNAGINLLKDHKSRDTKFWNDFVNSSDINKVVHFVSLFLVHGLGDKDIENRSVQEAIKRISHAGAENKMFSDKVLKRLSRENLLESINEETYSLEPFKSVFSQVRKDLRDFKLVSNFDITDFFKPFIPKGSNVEVLMFIDPFLLFKKFKSKDLMGITMNRGNSVSIILSSMGVLKKPDREKEIEAFINTLKHEIIHAIDFIRGAKKDGKVEVKREERKKKLGMNTANDFISYFSGIYEFNVAVNFLRIEKEKNTKLWKRFQEGSNREKVKVFVELFIIHSYSKEEREKILLGRRMRELRDSIIKDKVFFNRILRRLYREGFIQKQLKEETYNLEDLEPFYKKIREKLSDGFITTDLNATSYFKKFIPNNVEAEVYVFLDSLTLNSIPLSTNKDHLVRGTVFNKKNTVYIFINTCEIVGEPVTTETTNSIIDVLVHESIHVLDYLRSLSPKRKKPGKEIVIRKLGSKKRKAPNVSTPEGYLSYINRPYEFNVAINLMKDYKKNNPKEWATVFSKLSDIGKAKKIVEIFLVGNLNAMFSSSRKGREMLKKIFKEVERDKEFVKKAIKRLHREDLLENSFETKVRNYINYNE